MNAALLGKLAGYLLPLLAVRRSQAQGAAALVDGKGHTPRPVIGNDMAKIGMFLSISCQTAFQIGIVGVDLHSRI